MLSRPAQPPRAFDPRWSTGVSIDSVDNLPNHDLGLSADTLTSIVGAEAYRRLAALPARYSAQAAAAAAASGAMRLSGCFARRYCPYLPGHPALADEQPLTSFHFDSAAVTVNVALSGDDAVDGGKLLGVYSGAVHTISRKEGEATVHSSSLFHGVSCMRSGVRYSLIMFWAFG